jgi:formate dehydrogenase iron-sulfur subunit
MAKAVVVDLRRCIGCRACQVACKRWNSRQFEPTELNAEIGKEWTNPRDLSPNTFTYMRFRETGSGEDFQWHFAKVQCQHCLEPGCVSVCPTGALYKTEEGPVLYDKDLCIQCLFCVNFCPFQVPRFNSEERIIEKCTFCAERLNEGLEPACVAACPSDALTIWDYDEMLEKVNEAEAEGAYVYGRDEVGGTSWVYISSVPVTDLGFPKHGKELAFYGAAKELMRPLAGGLALITLIACGVAAVATRRRAREKEE